MATTKRTTEDLSKGEAEQLARVIVEGINYLHLRENLENAKLKLQKELQVGAACGLSQEMMAEAINGDAEQAKKLGRPTLSRQRVNQIIHYGGKNGKSRSE